MQWSHIILIGLLLQSIFILDTDANLYRRRRQRRQTSGSLYGTNAYLGASAPSGFNYPASYNIKGVRLNNPDARDLNGNPLLSSSSLNGGIPLTSVDSNGEPRPQIQQTYGTNDETVLNHYFSGSSFPTGSLNNQLFRDPNGNFIPMSSSFYSQPNIQQAYPVNPNQVLTNRDLYGTNTNNQLRNGNNYGGPMGTNLNNQLPNSNSYGGPMGSNTYSGSYSNNRHNLVPGSNTYSGYQGTLDNTNGWSNNNNYNNRPNTYGGNSYYPNRDTNYNYNYNNRYGNRYFNDSLRLSTSIGLLICSFLLTSMLSYF